jgi:hypothetical protein
MPLSLDNSKYREGVRQQLPVNNRVEKPVGLAEVVQFAGFDDRKYMIDLTGRGDYLNYLPANKFIIDVDTAAVLANGTVKEYFKDSLIAPVIWEYTESDAFKGDLAIMDMLSVNKWGRPVYYSTTVPSSQYKGLEKFFIQEGLAYRVAPVKTGEPEQGEYGAIDHIVMYDNMMNKFKWGNAADPGVYLDENNKRMFSNFRRIFSSLGKTLIQKGDTARAIEVARRGLEIVPSEKLPYDYFTIGLAEVLIRAGEKNEGDRILHGVIDLSKEYLDYASAVSPENRFGLDYPIGISMQGLLDIYNFAVDIKDEQMIKISEQEINNYYGRFYSGK